MTSDFMYASFWSCDHLSQSPGPGGPAGGFSEADAEAEGATAGGATAGGAEAEGAALGAALAAGEGEAASKPADSDGFDGWVGSVWPPPHPATPTAETRAETKKRAMRCFIALSCPTSPAIARPIA
ncbi:MAG: hypothetical protein ABSC94_17565 [Polyangiaceae bacterium]